MTKGFIIALAAGLLVVAALIGSVFYVKKGEHLVPRGSIVKVRTQAIDDKNSLAVLEVRLVNDFDVPMVVRQLEVTLQTKEGHELPGSLVSAADTKSVFQYYPKLGEQYNEPLMARDTVAPHETIDRMLAVRFEMPEPSLQDRRRIAVHIEDARGSAADITEK